MNEAELSHDLQQRPVALFGGQLVGAQTRCHGAAVGVFLPVDGEGVKVLPVEIHHRKEPVHPTAAQPQLGILRHGVAGIPSLGRLGGQVGVFADGGTGDLDPRTNGAHGFTDQLHGAIHVLAAPFGFGAAMAVAGVGAAIVEGNGGFGVANVVEMNAVDVIATDDFANQFGQIFGCAGNAGIELPFVAGAGAEFGHARGERLAPEAFGFGQRVARKGDEIGMQLHAAAVRFVDGETQHVVGRCHAGRAGKGAVPRLDVRGIGHGGADAGLEQYRVDAGGLQTIENARELCFLLEGFGRCAGIVAGGPVESAVGAEPHGAYTAGRGGDGGGCGRLCCGREREEEKQQGEKKTHGVGEWRDGAFSGDGDRAGEAARRAHRRRQHADCRADDGLRCGARGRGARWRGALAAGGRRDANGAAARGVRVP